MSFPSSEARDWARMNSNNTVEKEKQFARPGGLASQESVPSGGSSPAEPSHIDDFFNQLEGKHHSRPSPEAVAAARHAVQRLATEVDAEVGLNDVIAQPGANAASACTVCGHRNREGDRFCGMCGVPLQPTQIQLGADAGELPQPRSRSGMQTEPSGTHHYHHHYHHHYFPAGYDSAQPSGGAAPRAAEATLRDAGRARATASLKGQTLSRAEAAVRQLTEEWALACNTKQLDDLLEIYAADALVLRSNVPPVRGAAAIREFFFAALDAGLGEVEVEPIRVEVVGDTAYEAGRCKMLVPVAVGKRREERGKYLWVFARQSNGEWKLAADCWSSDLSLAVEPEASKAGGFTAGGLKAGPPRKTL